VPCPIDVMCRLCTSCYAMAHSGPWKVYVLVRDSVTHTWHGLHVGRYDSFSKMQSSGTAGCSWYTGHIAFCSLMSLLQGDCLVSCNILCWQSCAACCNPYACPARLGNFPLRVVAAAWFTLFLFCSAGLAAVLNVMLACPLELTSQRVKLVCHQESKWACISGTGS
jgi:hypothetical protein